MTILAMVGGHPGYGSCHLMLVLWVTFNCQIQHPQYFCFWWVTMLWLVGDHPRNDKGLSMAVVTYSCELSISAKTHHFSTLSSGGWRSLGWWATILGIVDNRPWHLSPSNSFESQVLVINSESEVYILLVGEHAWLEVSSCHLVLVLWGKSKCQIPSL